MEPKFDKFLERFDKFLERWDDERRKADEDRRKADRFQKELLQGLARIGKRILDNQAAAQKTLDALLKQFRLYGNGQAGGP